MSSRNVEDKGTTGIEKRIKDFDKKYYCILAAVMTLLIYGMTFSVNGMLSNGTKTIYRSDMIHQMIPYIKQLGRVVRGEHSYWFSWANLMGSGMSGNFAYYTLSPLNILIMICPDKLILTAVASVIVTKAAITSAIMQIFLSRFWRMRNYSTVLFAVLYSLCGYQICYYFLINLMDVLYIFPIIMLGILRLIKRQRMDLLLFAYSYAFIINFYTGYIAGISSFTLGIIALIYYKDTISRTNLYRLTVRYVLCVCNAVMISAIVWLPAIMQIIEGRGNIIQNDISTRTNPISIVFNMLIGQMQTLNCVSPFVYCGIINVILLPMFFFNKHISARIRNYFLLAVTIFVLILCVNPINYAFHAFDSPDMFGYREVYVLSFVICTIGCKQWMYIKSISTKMIVYIFGACTVLSIAAVFIYNLEKIDPNISIIQIFINVLFFVGWIIIILLYKYKEIRSVEFVIMAFFVIAIELVINSSICMNKMEHDVEVAKTYYAFQEIDRNTVNAINENGKEDYSRVLSLGTRQLNYAMDNDVNGISTFSSIEQADTAKLLEKLGMRRMVNSIAGEGSTEVTRSLLSVEYMLNCDVERSGGVSINLLDNEKQNIADMVHYEYGYGTCEYEKCDKVLSLGYIVDEKIKEYKSGRSPFDNQNNLLSLMVNQDIRCYSEVNFDVMNENGTLGVYKKGDDIIADYIVENTGLPMFELECDGEEGALFTFENNNESRKMYLYFDQYIYSNSLTIVSTVGHVVNLDWGQNNQQFSYSTILPIGRTKEGESVFWVYLPAEQKKDYYANLYTVAYDEEEYKRAYNILSSRQLNISEFEDGYVKGRVFAEDGDVLFTSIPYDEGWSAIVDGVKADIIPLVENAFLGVELDAGEHEIEFVYTAPGMWKGIVMSGIGCIMCISVIIIEINRKKKKKYETKYEKT